MSNNETTSHRISNETTSHRISKVIYERGAGRQWALVLLSIFNSLLIPASKGWNKFLI